LDQPGTPEKKEVSFRATKKRENWMECEEPLDKILIEQTLPEAVESLMDYLHNEIMPVVQPNLGSNL